MGSLRSSINKLTIGKKSRQDSFKIENFYRQIDSAFSKEEIWRYRNCYNPRQAHCIYLKQ